MIKEFFHLDVKTVFTDKFDSLVRVDKLIDRALEENMSAVAITDENVLHSVVEFYILARKKGIKPIIGLSMDVRYGKSNEKVKITFLAKNNKGYKNIVKMSSLAHLRQDSNLYITLDETKKYSEGNVAMIDAESILRNKAFNKTEDILNTLKKVVKGQDLYLMVKNFCLENQKEHLKNFSLVAKNSQVKIVASNDVHYFSENESKAREILKLIQGQKTKEFYETNQRYFKTKKEMLDLFIEYPEAIESTKEIVDKCNVVLHLKGEEGYSNKLPLFPIPKSFVPSSNLIDKFDILPGFQKPKNKYEAMSIAYLCDLAEKGYERFFEGQLEVKKRLKYELGVIISKGFTNYFLIVQDFVKYAKEKGISVGPGRGSAAGSLLSYCLGITEVSPIEYNLMFERFLNPERSDDPDIDIDISKEFRYKIFEYAQRKYGVVSAAKIVTFNNFGGKLAIRDVGRALGIEADIIDELAKEVTTGIKDLLKSKDMISRLVKKQPKVIELIEYAQSIEGLPKNRSVHAAGLVLSYQHLAKDIPVMAGSDKESGKPILITQIQKDLLEVMGFTKIDFLGLRNLDIVESVKSKVLKERNEEIKEIPLNDEKTFELYRKGETLGVFQMDSSEMRRTAMQVKPDKIQDIFPLIALYRPGSMDMIPIYAKNREKNEFVIYDMVEEYDSEQRKMVKRFVPFEENVDILKPILDETYGVIVYQEQIIKILQTWAGYRLGEADIVRRAISKKVKHMLEENKRVFLEKSIEKGRDKKTSIRLYDLIVKFANYGFNVPHAASYGLFSYETAYLKTHYPVEFMSASISSLMDETKKSSIYMKEARRMGIEIQKPDINKSDVAFEVDGNTLIFGLTVIKNVGLKTSQAIVNERKNGEYTSFNNFLNRMKSKGVDERCVKSLIKIGAFDEFGNRKELLNAVGNKTKVNPLLENQYTFDEIPEIGSDENIIVEKTDDFSIEEKIKFEESLIGVTFTKLPSDIYEKEIKELVTSKNENSEFPWIGGCIVGKKVIKDKNKNDMAFITLSDGEKQISVTIFSSLWKKVKSEIETYRICLIKVREKNDKYSALEFVPIQETRRMFLELPIESIFKEKEDMVNWLKNFVELVKNKDGFDQLILNYGRNKKVYSVELSKEFVKEIQNLGVKSEHITFDKVQYK